MTKVTDYRIKFTNSLHSTQYITRKQLGEQVTRDFVKMVKRKLCPTKCGCSSDLAYTHNSRYTIAKTETKPYKYFIAASKPELNDALIDAERKGYNNGYKEAYDLAYNKGVEDTQRDSYNKGRNHGRAEGRKLAERAIEERLEAATRQALADWETKSGFEQVYDALKRMRACLTNIHDAKHKLNDVKLQIRWTITFKHLLQAFEEFEDLTIKDELTLNPTPTQAETSHG